MDSIKKVRVTYLKLVLFRVTYLKEQKHHCLNRFLKPVLAQCSN